MADVKLNSDGMKALCTPLQIDLTGKPANFDFKMLIAQLTDEVADLADNDIIKAISNADAKALMIILTAVLAPELRRPISIANKGARFGLTTD